MSKLRYSWVMTTVACSALLASSGCLALPWFMVPIPMPPWVAERMEEKYCHKNDHRTPVMPPIPEGGPVPTCEDKPSDGQVIRALPRVARGVPFVYEEFRDNYQVVVEPLVDVIDPVRFIPLIGPARLHHCHWKCTVYFRETKESSYPFPVRCSRDRVEVIYIDTDHFHLAPGGSPELQQKMTKEMIGR